MKMVIDDLQIQGIITAFNGGLFVRPDLSVFRENLLLTEVVQPVIDTLTKHKLDVWVYIDKDWYVRTRAAPHVDREEWTVKFAPMGVPKFAGFLDRAAKIVGVSDDLETVARCAKDAQQGFGQHVSAARSQPYYLDVTQPKANKGEVIDVLSELLKIPAANIATIGDMPSDVLMFRRSGVSIAMGNASSDVKHAAKFVTSSNQQEGFALAMERFVLRINDSVRAKGSCSLILSGGNTPRTLYGLLSVWSRERIPWAQVYIFWGDERQVSSDDPQSNYRMAKETLLDHVPCPAGNVHPMPTHCPDPDVAARYYERILRRYFSAKWPRFDLIFLGLGEEGHTASLFPGSPVLKERSRWVLSVKAPAEPSVRLTLTLPVLTHAANIYFLLTGAKKAEGLQHVLAGTANPQSYPAAGVRVAKGNLVWCADRVAATLVGQSAA